MIRFLIAGIALFAMHDAAAQSEEKLKISKLTDRLYVYTTYNDYKGTPFPSNSMYYVTDGGVVLFDTPWDSTQFQPLLDTIQKRHKKKVVMCIATHYHSDRTAGLEYYKSKGIKTYSSWNTWRLSKRNNEKQSQYYFSNEDSLFKVGNQFFTAMYLGEGHTEDNIVIWFPDEKTLYGGCLIKSTEATDLGNTEDANLKEWSKTIKALIKIFQEKAKYIIPGHMGWSNIGSLQHTLRLLDKR
jgi:glyoxylase-like metal-dependent hydrolase (beta-lactamase superfamily II)